MPKVMFPFSQAELERRAARAAAELAQGNPQPKREWVKRGFFKGKPMSRRDVAMKASNARLWLEYTLREPMPAREVLRLAKLEGLSEWGVRRAKKRLRIKTVKTGGRYRGYGAQWIWQVPVSN